ncbi:DnaA regulatory inactivator Hda [Cobetia sp. MMG027]|uniref:DnaA regulatory inactivator Hda n=1 Tax=Cobetia sp. MMG027 TaxID=3021980 RepID=UPI0022FEB5A0|nr:DnaA regulatory inactivator Hda [Cobetia sp. MMG027]MDA5565051.1 DnaA regulatory inactivator Hda [Cobetia sp. MMG027]
MAMTQGQMALGVGVRDAATFDNYHFTSTSLAEALKGQLADGGEPFVYLWGGEQSGRSHLLQAACHLAGQQGKRAFYLPLKEIGHFPPHMLEGLDEMDLVAIDDLESVIGRKRWEEALFHLYNRLRDSGRHLLVSASCAPRLLPVTLPDLASRLSWGVTFHLSGLDDAQRLEALKLRAKDHGLALPDEVARYILHRGPRSLPGLFAAMIELDNASLSAQRKLTIPFVKQTLGW